MCSDGTQELGATLSLVVRGAVRPLPLTRLGRRRLWGPSRSLMPQSTGARGLGKPGVPTGPVGLETLMASTRSLAAARVPGGALGRGSNVPGCEAKRKAVRPQAMAIQPSGSQPGEGTGQQLSAGTAPGPAPGDRPWPEGPGASSATALRPLRR